MLKYDSPEYEAALHQVLELPPNERLALVEAVIASFRVDLIADTPVHEPPLTPEEVAALMHIEPLTGAEIVAQGLTGGWADLGIEDGAEWVNERKRQRKTRLKW